MVLLLLVIGSTKKILILLESSDMVETEFITFLKETPYSAL